MKRVIILLLVPVLLFGCKLNQDERIAMRLSGIYTIDRVEISGEINETYRDSVGEIAFVYEGNNLGRLNPGEIALKTNLEDKFAFFQAMRQKNNFYWRLAETKIDGEVNIGSFLPVPFELEIQKNKPKKKILVFEGVYKEPNGVSKNVTEYIHLTLKDI